MKKKVTADGVVKGQLGLRKGEERRSTSPGHRWRRQRAAGAAGENEDHMQKKKEESFDKL